MPGWLVIIAGAVHVGAPRCLLGWVADVPRFCGRRAMVIRASFLMSTWTRWDARCRGWRGCGPLELVEAIQVVAQHPGGCRHGRQPRQFVSYVMCPAEPEFPVLNGDRERADVGLGQKKEQ